MILQKSKTVIKSKLIDLYSLIHMAEYKEYQNIYVTMTIDTEQDVNYKYVNQGTYRNIEYGIPKIIDLFDKYDCKGTFLITPDVANNSDLSKDIIYKHEIGCHIHPEFFTMDSIKNIRHKEYLCNFQYKNQEDMIMGGTKIIENSFRYRPVSFRAGRFGSNMKTIDVLIKNGYIVDTSFTPYINWGIDYGPNFSDIKNQPFFLHNTYGKLLEIPITIINLYGIKYWLRPSVSDNNMAKKIILYIKDDSNGHIQDMVLNIMFHSMESIDPNPYCKSDEFICRLENIIRYLYTRESKFVTCKDLYKTYKIEKVL